MKIKAWIISIIFAPAMALAATPVALPATTAQAPNLDITGIYQCTGYDPYAQQNYGSIVNINKVADRIYSITDQTLVAHSPDTTHVDVFSDRETGILNNNVLAIAYQNRRQPIEQGVEQVTFSSDGNSFFGIWTQMGGTMVGTELCHKLTDSPISSS